MKKRMVFKVITAILLIAAVSIGIIGCSDEPIRTNGSGNNNAANNNANNDGNNASAPANTNPITVVWYPNESANDYEPSRNEFGRLLTLQTQSRWARQPERAVSAMIYLWQAASTLIYASLDLSRMSL